MDKNNVLADDPKGLWDRFREGDEAAFAVLYKLHFGRLFLVIRELVGQQDLAEDVVTNSFIRLFERRDRIREMEQVYPFLFVVARNEAISHLRILQRQRLARKEIEKLVDTEYRDPREAELERDQLMEKIQQLVELLPPRQRKIFRLHFFDGLTIREIANQLKLTETTVRNQRNRALIFLRQAFLL